MRKTVIAAMTALIMVLGAIPAYAHSSGHSDTRDRGRSELREVKRATAKYQRLSKALTDGFGAFSLDLENPDIPTCFDSPSGGMGVHYVRNIDAVVDAKDPEAMVYEVGRYGRLKLVAVEYIVPIELVDPENPPELFGQEFHQHSYLPVYILHAWIWKHNPSGMFMDFNPRVGACPA